MKRLIGISMLALLLVLSSCSVGGKTVKVGAKNFTEQAILAKMSVFLLEDNGFQVDEISELGSTALRQALETEQIDITWDYVGTGLVTYLDQPPIADSEEAFAEVKHLDEENDIVWTNLTEANNTYAIMMQEEEAEELGIETISDFAAYINENPGEINFATDAEFANRADGLAGMEEFYDFSLEGSITELETGLYYNALNNNEVNASVGFSTDARIDDFGFRVLEDDQGFFPSYSAAVSMTEDVYEEYPEIEEIFAPLEDILDSETMRDLNYQVDIEGESVELVVQQFLQENNLIEE